MRSALVVLLAVTAFGCASRKAREADAEGLRQLTASKACDNLPLGSEALTDCALRTGTVGDPIPSFRRAVALDPNVGLYHYHLAQALAQARFQREALAELRAATLTTPPYGPAVEHLARLERERIADEVADTLEARRAH